MGISNENVSQEFTATGGQTVFPFSLAFFSTTNLIVKKNGLTLTAPDYSIGSLVSSNPYTGATLTLTSGATLGDSIEIIRDVPFTMDQFLALNDTFAAKAAAIQSALDKLTLMAQECKAVAEEAYALVYTNTPYPLPSPSALKAVRWNTSADALENFDAALQDDLDTVESSVSTLSSSLSTINNRITDLEVRTLILEDIILGDVDSQEILNSQATPIVLSDFTTDGNDFTSVKIQYEIMRRTGTEYRSSCGDLYMVFRDNGVWATDRGLTFVDMDGVTFSINTLPNDIGQVSYTSDTLAGAGYAGYIKYRITKFKK